MGLFEKFFGKKKPLSSPPRQPISAPKPAPETEKPIRVFDSFGRELFVPREEWRKTILPDNIKSSWNDPAQLLPIVNGAIDDGFLEEIAPAARHLFALNPTPPTCSLWSYVLVKQQQLDAAETVCKNFIAKHGENPTTLVSLAQIHFARNAVQLTESTLWHALELDPNHDHAFGWYLAISRERGEASEEEALQRIQNLPQSWRARLWLARRALDRKELPAAIDLYRQALALTPSPPPFDLLQQMSGDLGKHGHLSQLIALTTPHYDAKLHGIDVGNNLIKASLDTGDLSKAREFLDELASMRRPDWKGTVDFWEAELTKAEVAARPAAPLEELRMRLLSIDGPIWLPAGSPIEKLFPPKSPEFPKIAFLGSSAEDPTITEVKHQLSDQSGRLARATPLFLAEQIFFRTTARVATLTPRITSPTPGFVLCGGPWSDSDAADRTRNLPDPADHVVITHLRPHDSKFRLELRLIKTIDAECLGTRAVPLDPNHPEAALPALVDLLRTLLLEHGIIEERPLPDFYQVPLGNLFWQYLLRIEQLLAVRASAQDHPEVSSLTGVREIVDGNIAFAAHMPTNPIVRFVLLQTLASLNHSKPRIVSEIKPTLLQLQQTYPMPAPFNAITTAMLTQIYPEHP